MYFQKLNAPAEQTQWSRNKLDQGTWQWSIRYTVTDRELAFPDCGSWLNSLCKLLSSHLILELKVHSAGIQEGKMDIKWKRARASWTPQRCLRICQFCLSNLHAVDVLQGKLRSFLLEASSGVGKLKMNTEEAKSCGHSCYLTTIRWAISNNICEMQKLLPEFLGVKTKMTTASFLTQKISCGPPYPETEREGNSEQHHSA